MALLYALGHEEFLRKEGSIPPDEDSKSMAKLFESWHDQPAREDISQTPSFAHESTCLHVSNVLGIRIVISAPNNPTSASVAESLLGALEAYLATSNEEYLMPHKSDVTITITEKNDDCNTILSKFTDIGSDIARVEHSVKLRVETRLEQESFFNWLQETIIMVICNMVMIRDVKEWMERIAGEERGLSRALAIGNMVTMNRNVFGESPQLRLNDWIDNESRSFTLDREGPWRRSKSKSHKGGSKAPKFGAGDPPPGLLDREQLRHSDMRVTSPINIQFWDKANWRGTFFLQYPTSPFILGIAFERLDLGVEIFREWRGRWGNDDKDDRLRVAIITGVSSIHPASYSVIIGPNVNTIDNDGGKVYKLISRLQRMEPETTKNLDTFLAAYKRAGAYLLMPTNLDPQNPELHFECAILKRNLVVRKAWEIGENDPDICAIQDGDSPILPADVQDPPILRALEQRRVRENMHQK